jgi:hypothetical protein
MGKYKIPWTSRQPGQATCKRERKSDCPQAFTTHVGQDGRWTEGKDGQRIAERRQSQWDLLVHGTRDGREKMSRMPLMTVGGLWEEKVWGML